jgi:hypothetical protein
MDTEGDIDIRDMFHYHSQLKGVMLDAKTCVGAVEAYK